MRCGRDSQLLTASAMCCITPGNAEVFLNAKHTLTRLLGVTDLRPGCARSMCHGVIYDKIVVDLSGISHPEPGVVDRFVSPELPLESLLAPEGVMKKLVITTGFITKIYVE
ncbi:hypothetical protein J6590_016473 [Homalodisca vitripennis]|nr:hypothetical protein J6590_016473 [Homalodisca vitripennis]